MRIIIDNENNGNFEVDVTTNEREKDFETIFHLFSYAISRAMIEFLDTNAKDCYTKFEYGELLREDIQMRVGEWLDQAFEKDREKENNRKAVKQCMKNILDLWFYKNNISEKDLLEKFDKNNEMKLSVKTEGDFVKIILSEKNSNKEVVIASFSRGLSECDIWDICFEADVVIVMISKIVYGEELNPITSNRTTRNFGDELLKLVKPLLN